MDSWMVPVPSLNIKEVFRIGLVDHPHGSRKNMDVFRIGHVDGPRIEPLKQGGVPDRPRMEPKNEEVFQMEPTCFI